MAINVITCYDSADGWKADRQVGRTVPDTGSERRLPKAGSPRIRTSRVDDCYSVVLSLLGSG
jgi:hypothetical protein